MTPRDQHPDAEHPPLTPPRASAPWRPVLAWALVILVVAATAIAVNLAGDDLKPDDEDPLGRMMVNINGRYLVGVSQLTPLGTEGFDEHIKTLATGSVEQRLGAVVIAGEVVGPHAAAEMLHAFDEAVAKHNPPLSESQRRLIDAVNHLYLANPDAPPSADAADPAARLDQLTTDDRDRLIDRLGWLGRLALHPPDGPDADQRESLLSSAKWAGLFLITARLTITGLGLAGLVGLIVTIVVIARAPHRLAFTTAAGSHALYIETFAIWLILFTVLQTLTALIGGGLALSVVVFFVSLIALFWPRFAGVTGPAIRRDLGLTAGTGVIRETLWGIAGYAMTLPLLGVGVLLTLLLVALSASLSGPPQPFAPAGGASHPVAEYVVGADWRLFLTLLTLGAVAAPVVEELLFRGALYQHLRSATKHTGRLASVAIAGLINTFLFAVIHPQGLVAVPALMSLALGFTLMREWRGSIISAVVMHAINNGMIFTGLYIVLNI